MKFFKVFEKSIGGLPTHYLTNSGVEVWVEYDNNGRIVGYRDSNGVERTAVYSEKGKLLSYKDNCGYDYKADYCEDKRLSYSLIEV